MFDIKSKMYNPFFFCCKSTCFWVLLKAFGILHS